MAGGLFRQRGHVQPTQRYIRAACAVTIGQRIGAIGVGDIDLDEHQIGGIILGQGFDVLIKEP